MIKKILKKIFPQSLLLFYHSLQSSLASFWYKNPSSKLFVIGVTGTKGKSTSCNFIWSVLQAGGFKTALTGTANFRLGSEEKMNPYHLSMPGPWVIQKFLRKAVDSGCTHAIIEATSEGMKQHREKGIDFNVAVFTGLTPEHLASHGGSFEKYREAKQRLFVALKKSPKSGKISILNKDSDQVSFFENYKVDEKIYFGLSGDAKATDVIASEISQTSDFVKFKVGSKTGSDDFEINFPGEFNVMNTLPAIAIGQKLGINIEKIKSGIKSLKTVAGRMEKISTEQDFTVFVDYAHEPNSMGHLLNTLKTVVGVGKKIIILLGAEGGGRDKTKRALMGKQVAELADFVVVSNVDPYEDDPKKIIEDIAVACEKFGKTRGKNLFTIEDRGAGIAKALSLASQGDIVAITGKGAEQSITIDGVKSDWDDRMVVKEELGKVK